MPSPYHNNGEAVVGSAIPYKTNNLENSMNSTTPSAATIHINTTSNDLHNNTSTTSSAPNEQQYQNSSSNNINNHQHQQQNNTMLPQQQEVTTTTTTSLTTKQALKSSVLMTTTTAVVLNGTNNVTPTINTHTSVSSSSSTSINPASASSAMKHHQHSNSSTNNARPRTHSNPHAFSYRTSHHQQHYGTNSRDSFFSNLLSSISTDSNGSSRKKEFKQSITLLRNFIVRSRNAIFLVLLLLCVVASLLFVYNLRSGVFTKIQNTITTSVDDSMDSLEEATTIYDHSTYDGSLIANRHHQEPVSKSTWESLQSSDPRTDKLVMGVDEQPQEKKKNKKKKVIQQSQQQQTEEEQTNSEQNPKLMMENNKATKTTTPIQPESGDKTLPTTDMKPLPYIKPLNHHDIPLPTRKPTPQEENEVNTEFKIDHIYVINLKIREDRRQKSIRRLNTLGGIFSNYTFFEPVFGEALTDQDIFNHVSITTYKAILEGRSLDYQLSTKGGVGCYLTHTNIWKDMIEKGYERVLIFEDDFEITSPYDEIMTYFSHLPKKFDVAFMYFSLFPGSGEFERYNDYWMTTTATRVYGAASYIINRSAAEKLLEKAFPIDLQLDAFINHYVTFTGGLRLYSSKLLFGHEITELFKTNVQDYCWKCIANNLMDNFLSVEIVFNVFLIMLVVIVALVLYVKFFSKILARKRGKQDRLAEWSHDE